MKWLRILTLLELQIIRLTNRVKELTMDFTKLQAALDKNTSAVDSAVVLIQHIADEIRSLNPAADQTALDTFAAQLDAEAQKLADSVVANTGV